MKKAKLLNGYFDQISFKETIDRIFREINRGKSIYLCTVNVAILMAMRANQRLQKFINNADIIVADGKPLVWFAPLFGVQLPERIAGIDLIYELCRKAEEKKLGVYFLGAKSHVLKEAVRKIQNSYPKLKISGFSDGYFTADEALERVSDINRSGADILFVAMGVPRQDYFIDAYRKNLNVKLSIGVGGSLDVISGEMRRAPKLLQKIGLEWLFRLTQEPKRLFKRYLVTNFQFLLLIFKQLIKKIHN